MSRPCEDISERWWGVPQTYPSYVDEALIVDVFADSSPARNQEAFGDRDASSCLGWVNHYGERWVGVPHRSPRQLLRFSTPALKAVR